MDETIPSGDSFLREAFAPEPETPEVPEPEAGVPSDTPVAETETPTPTDTPVPSTVDVFANPIFQRTVDQQVKARLEESERQQKLAAYNEWVAGLDDESYGKVMRAQQAEIAKYTSTRDAVAGQFAEQATKDVLASISELGKLSAEEAAKVDPMNKDYKSYGQWVSAVADVVAERRAEARAQAKLKAEVEARVTEEVAKLQKQYPKQPAARAGAPAGEDLSKMSGDDLLRAAFA